MDKLQKLFYGVSSPLKFRLIAADLERIAGRENIISADSLKLEIYVIPANEELLIAPATVAFDRSRLAAAEESADN